MEYFKTELGTLYNDDSLELLKTFPNNSIDTIITDPPYGLEFMGKEWDKYSTSERYQKWVEQWAKELLRVAKPGATLLAFGGTRTFHRLACGLEDAGWVIKDTLMWLYGSGFPKATDISKQIDKKFGVKRKVVGYVERFGREGRKANCGFKKDYIGASGTQNLSAKKSIEEPATSEAKLWNGYKSHGLKPAYEPIIMAMKPNEGSYANNALKWGVAGLNIDAGRIGYKSDKDKKGSRVGFMKTNRIKGLQSVNYGGEKDKRTEDWEISSQGRFPANILLDEEAAKMLDEQSGELGISKKGSNRGTKVSVFGMKNKDIGNMGYGDTGGASRFFYVAKASKKERNMGLENMPDKIGGGMQGTQDKTLLTGSGNVRNNIMKNNHPTVKPLKLMRYLVRLTSMPNPNQVYLDLFLGSGTTAMACELEGKHWIGIEKEKEYCEIAKARISAVPNHLF